MAKLVAVHKTMEEDVGKIVAYLESRCLHPVVLDDTEKMSVYRHQVREIQIGVPETERDVAVQVLEQMLRQEQSRLSPLVKKTNAVVFLVVVVLITLAVVAIFDRRGIYLLALELVVAAFVAKALIRRAWGQKPDVPSAEKPDRK